MPRMNVAPQDGASASWPVRRNAACTSGENAGVHAAAAANAAAPARLATSTMIQSGEHALGETSASLGWSGLAAGLSMGFSLAGEGLLKAHLPEAIWTPLVSKFATRWDS